MEKEKLQQVNKIMLATGTINYLATHIHTINQQMIFSNATHGDNPHKQSLHDQKQTLNRTLLHLEKAMNELAEYMEGYDCLMPLDTLVIQPSFYVISEGMDEVDRTKF